MPGQPARTRARIRISPRQLTLESCQSATSVTAIITLASVENCHVFAEPTLFRNVANRNRKTFPACAEAVDDETSLWKAEEKCGANRAQK